MTYTSAPAGMSPGTKKDPAFAWHRPATPFSTNTASDSATTDGRSNSTPSAPGVRRTMSASRPPVPPPTSTTAIAAAPAAQSYESAASPAAAVYVLSARIDSSNVCCATGLAPM